MSWKSSSPVTISEGEDNVVAHGNQASETSTGEYTKKFSSGTALQLFCVFIVEISTT